MRKLTHMLMFVLLLTACGGEQVAPVGPDVSEVSLEMYGGRERILCRWSGMPREVERLRLAMGEAPVELPVTGTAAEVWIPAQKEGEHYCTVTYLTAQSEVPGPSVSVHVYGAKYEASLISRPVTGARLFEGKLSVSFSPTIPSALSGEEIRYKDADGEEQLHQLPLAAGSGSITGVGEALQYRSVYMPVSQTGDLFYGPWTDLPDLRPVEPLPEQVCATVDGYRGIWFTLGQVNTEYGDKYSGGLGTYTMKHIPMAIYAPEVDRTYFVYGGTPAEDQRYLQCMIGCYDHATGKLQKPRVVMDKGVLGVKDPHDNPTVQIDRDGYVWVFVSGRSTSREGYRYRSINPYDITAFEVVSHDMMAYPQVMYHPEKGFFLFFTRYDGVRQLFWRTSPDGRTWTNYKQLASIKEGSESKSGHYQISNICGTKVCTAFNRHINGSVDTRTNIYYVQSTDWGENWTTAAGEKVTVPVTTRTNNALVRDYQSLGKNCYIKDLNFDEAGNPVILYLISDNHLTGPEGGIREWFTLHWTGSEWEQAKVTESTHCYDSGSLWIEDGKWTIVAPTGDGPQYWGAGGEVQVFHSLDKGKSWTWTSNITHDNVLNQTYVRRPWYASKGFWAFWADGNPDKLSRSSLYFCTAEGKVFRMPYDQTEEWSAPEAVN